MQLLILCLALLSASVSALPSTLPIIMKRGEACCFSDGRGATIYTEQNYQGGSGAIPPIAWCSDLNNMFFGQDLDGKTRSIIVEPGMKCSFYTNYGCPDNSPKLVFGDKGQALGYGTLPSEMDQNIHSVNCAPI